MVAWVLGLGGGVHFLRLSRAIGYVPAFRAAFLGLLSASERAFQAQRPSTSAEDVLGVTAHATCATR